MYESHLFADDPYYSALRARIPNFVKSRKKKQAEKEAKERQQQQAAAAAAGQQHPGQPGFHPGTSLSFNHTKADSRRLLWINAAPPLSFRTKKGFEFFRKNVEKSLR